MSRCIHRRRKAAFFSARQREVRCQQCGAGFHDMTEFAEFIGWHGVCVDCFMKASS